MTSYGIGSYVRRPGAFGGSARKVTDAASMVTEPCGANDIDVLCVECGWQAHIAVPTAPWVVFKDHSCWELA